MLSFKTYLQEGINDPAIFKAVFMAGGPGSGKSFIADMSALKSMGLKMVASDDAFEYELKKAGLQPNPEDIASTKGQKLRDKAKGLTNIKHKGFLSGRLGIVIDGTGHDFGRIKKEKSQLEKLGYEVAMVFVNTSLETAQSRNLERSRSLNRGLVSDKWNHVQQNLGAFQNLFGSKMFIIDNNVGQDVDSNTTKLFKKVRKWTQQKPSSHIAQKWISAQRSS